MKILGIHHLGVVVHELEKGGLQMLSAGPQEGAEGSRVVFIHPRSFGGILLELRESRGGPGRIQP